MSTLYFQILFEDNIINEVKELKKTTQEENEELKNILFEIYSAGYIDGHDGLVDIQTGYEKWFNSIEKTYIQI